MDLVVLAAGAGTRFGGSKQLAPVGPRGEAIVDVLIERAAAAGFARVVIVVSDEIGGAVRAHLASHPPTVTVELATQERLGEGGGCLGTAHAVLAARELVTGSFGVVNADDLYPPLAFALLERHLDAGRADEHAILAFPVARTLVGARPVSRALIDADDDGRMVGIREATVAGPPGDLRADVAGERLALRDDASVSMNMFGFRPSVFGALARAVADHVGGGRPGEVRLPDVVGTLVASGAIVRVLPCDAPCIGITYRDDVAAVTAALA